MQPLIPGLDTDMREEFTLSRLAASLAESVRRNPSLQNVWVSAELSDVRTSGGHCYMELVEKNEAGQTVAKMRATVWASRYGQLRVKFSQATGRDISTGIKVLVQGSVSHHAVYGLSFNIFDIDPSYTLGDMERRRRMILDTLVKENVIDRNKRLEMPVAPQRIAVISAPGAAGYGDFMRHLEANREGFVFYTMLFPAVMQGESAAESVGEALRRIEMSIDMWDCVAILRGGGATTDLNCFDDLVLARAVALFPIPVVAGIGHERDRTVLDEIAHTRVKTPTAAAAFFIDSLREAYMRARESVETMMRYVADRVSGEKRNLSGLGGIILSAAPARLSAGSGRLDHVAELIPSLVARRVAMARSSLQELASGLSLVAMRRTEREKSRISLFAGRMAESVQFTMRRANERIASTERLVRALSPKETLRRGYSITRVNGHAVTSAVGLRPGDRITTTLHDGVINSTIDGNGR